MIVKVKKARLFTIESQLDKLLKVLQKKELFMVSGEPKKDDSKENLDSLIQRAKKCVEYVDTFQGKKPFFDFLEVDESRFENDYRDSLFIIDEVEENERVISTSENRNKEIVKIINEISPFKSLVLETSYLHDTRYVDIYTGYLSTDQMESLETFVKANSQFLYEVLDDGLKVKSLILVAPKGELDLIEYLNTISFSETNLPIYNKKIIDEIELLQEESINNNEIIVNTKAKLEGNKELLNNLKILHDQLINQRNRNLVDYQKTESTVYVEGWVWEEKIDKLNQVIKDNELLCEVEFKDLEPDEVPPTALKNNKFVKPFEDITNMYAPPAYHEIDPNPSMSIWYWIIFGIMMGDIGYGIVMVLVCGLFLKLKKPKGGLKNLVTVFFYSGFTAILAGIAFGSLFGTDFDILKLINSNWSSTLVNPVNDPITMLIFSLGLGALHIIHGLIMKIINCVRAKDYMGAFADAGSWIIIILGAGVAAVSMVTELSIYIGLGIAGAGLLIVIAFAGRGAEGKWWIGRFFKRLVGGLGAAYGISGYLSDILSYSRILALALSSAVIASTMNLLGGMISGGWRIIISIIIWIIGHVFNFVMGLLSAYVHDGRLQYIEFYGKFYEGNGYLFEPLKNDLKYIDEIKYESGGIIK